MKCDATFSEDWYSFQFPEEQISIFMERLTEKRTSTGGIQCEMTIETSDHMTGGGLLYNGNFNLLTSNQALVNKLKSRVEIDWDGVLTQVAHLAKTRYREGEPIIDLSTVESTDSPRWLLPGFIEDTVRPTLIAAGGGTGKSTIGVAAAMSVATNIPFLNIFPERVCPVLYMDWEADPQIHSERAQALWRGQGLDGKFSSESLFYQRQTASLHELISSLKKKIYEQNIGFAVLDSVGMARGGAPEDAEATIKLFNAVRKMNIPVLAIDHMSKEALSNKNGHQTAIGSVYTTNSVCRVWIMKSSDDGTGISLDDVKRNNTKRQKTLGFNIHYMHDGSIDQRAAEIIYESTDFRDLDSSVQPSGQKYQIMHVIQNNGGLPMAIKDIAEATGMSQAHTRVVVNRNLEDFVKISGNIALKTEAVQV
jgi:hypothetical protein